MLKKIISGGQTGADRAGLDAAIKHGIEHGGSIPLGRRTEDGVLPSLYNLQELSTQSYPARTEKNILDADGTVIISHGTLTGGSKLTQEKAIQHMKPSLHLNFNELSVEMGGKLLYDFVVTKNIEILNVAGPRASGDPAVDGATMRVLDELFRLFNNLGGEL